MNQFKIAFMGDSIQISKLWFDQNKYGDLFGNTIHYTMVGVIFSVGYTDTALLGYLQCGLCVHAVSYSFTDNT